MAELSYRGLAEFGLPLVTREDLTFATLVRDIEELLEPRLAGPALDSDRAAVLLNNTGRAIIGTEFVWRYTARAGKTRTTRFSSFVSSAQREVLTGKAKVGRDLGTFILPGSKRLITERGIFGNNLDVLAPEELPRAQGYRGGGFGGGGFGGGGPRGGAESEIAAIELVLDLVILEDGLCVGPDESGLYEALNESLDLQRRAAQEAVTALQAGASEGRLFEIIRPLARQRPPNPRGDRAHNHAMPLRMTFGSEAVHHLINANASELLAFFEKAAQPPSLQLRRPV